MHARQKLNVAYLNGAILPAIVAGVLCQSWLVFAFVAVGGILIGLYLGNIRPARHQ
jgi:hypothetical protein